MEETQAKLDWNFSKVGSELLIEYTVTNQLNERLYILDQMIRFAPQAGLELAPEAAIAQCSEKSESPPTVTVDIVKGYVQPMRSPKLLIVPGARGIAPGESLSGAVRLGIPLCSWHPNEESQPIPCCQELRLKIGALVGDISWRYQPLADGSKATIPSKVDLNSQIFITSEPQPAP